MKASGRRRSFTRLLFVGIAAAVLVVLLVIVALAIAIIPTARDNSAIESTARNEQGILGSPLIERARIETEETAPPSAAAAPVMVEREAEEVQAVLGTPAEDRERPPGAPALVDRKIVRNATLEIIVTQIADALDRIELVVSGIAGAYVADSDVKDRDSRLPSRVVLRVPSESFETAVTEVKALAIEVLDERIGTRDVTEQFTDLASQLRNLRATENQYLALLDRAETVEDIVQIQDRLSGVRGEIELLQGRLNLLENEVDLATITVILHTPPDLRVELSPQGAPASGQSFTTFIDYGNEGSVRAREVVVQLSVPDGLRFEMAGSGGKYDSSARSVTWKLGELTPGADGRVTATFLAEPAGGALGSDAFIESATAEKKPENNADRVTIHFVPDLAVDLFGPSSLAEGSQGELLLQMENRGTGNADDVTVKLSIPHGTTFVSADGGGAYDESSREIVWKLGRLGPNRSEDFTGTIRVDVRKGKTRLRGVVDIGRRGRLGARQCFQSVNHGHRRGRVGARRLAARQHRVKQRRNARHVCPGARGCSYMDRDVRGSPGRRRRSCRHTRDPC